VSATATNKNVKKKQIQTLELQIQSHIISNFKKQNLPFPISTGYLIMNHDGTQ
jgi:hypothetical protein